MEVKMKFTEEELEVIKNNNTSKVYKNGTVWDSRFYGRFEIIGALDMKHYLIIRFVETGYVTKITKAHVKSGKVKDLLHPRVFGVGYQGEGRYTPSTHPEFYSKWAEMLRRCYSEKELARSPTYKNCMVCSRWHNFQNYVEDVSDLMEQLGINSLKGMVTDK